MKNLFCYTMLISMMVGCQSKEGATPSSQVVAKVNGDEITVHQINAELQHLHGAIPNTQTVTKRVIDGLVDRQLLVQEAIKLNIDRTPEVQQLVDAARAQIYAQAYLSRKTASIKPASDADINQFIQAQPGLFSQRKIFETTDVVFANNPDKVDYQKLQAQVTNLEELKTWLETNHISYDVATEKLPSEALPSQALTMLAQVKQGDLLFMRDDLKVIVRSVNNIVESPLNESQSVAVAQKIINNKQREQFIQNELSRLRKLSKIDYSNNSLTVESQANDSPLAATGLSNR